jgi:uncharacterized repeat protein (TIGR04052 family)
MSMLRTALVSLAPLALVASCTTPEHEHAMEAFTLRFAASANGQEVGCGSEITGLGPDGQHIVRPADLRFYVSNLRFYDAAGEPIELELDEDEFQYRSEAGEVALVDLTATSEGACAGSAAAAEATTRTHAAITGKTHLGEVARISFDVGVPQPLMQATIATSTAEAAPSPLDEMYWSWATGYRHLVFNFEVDAAGEVGEGYVHIGSRDCGVEGSLALEDRDECTFVNNPAVELDGFDLAADTVMLDIPALLASLDFVSPIYDPETFEPIGEAPGVECHSSPMQPDCATLFDNVGLDIATGSASASANAVFSGG